METGLNIAVNLEKLEQLIRKVVREELDKTKDVSIGVKESFPISSKMLRISELSKKDKRSHPRAREIEDKFISKLSDEDKEIFFQYPHLRDKITIAVENGGNLLQLNIVQFIKYENQKSF